MLLFAVWILSTSSSFNNCEANQTAAKSEQAKANSPPIARSLTDDIAIKVRCAGHVIYEYREAATAVATIFIALFTLTLWWSTKEMMGATKRSVDLAREEFIATHRPRVIIRFIRGPFADENWRRFIFIEFVNVGETRATIRAIGAQLAMRRDNGVWEPGVDTAPVDIDPIVLETGQRHMIQVWTVRPYSDEDIWSDVNDATDLCTVGRIEYRDDNGVTRETAFLRVCDERDRFVASKNPEEEYQD